MIAIPTCEADGGKKKAAGRGAPAAFAGRRP